MSQSNPRRIMIMECTQRERRVRTAAPLGCATRRAYTPAQPKEGPLKKDEQRPKLPLKQVGKLTDVELAQWIVRDLRRLLEEKPREFQTLVALVEGRKEGVSRASIIHLRNKMFLAKDGSPLPAVADVVRAAYRPATPDGPCVVDALDLQTPHDVAVAEAVEDKREKRVRKGRGLQRLLRDMSRDDQDTGPSRE
jgi:hypothetical protein